MAILEPDVRYADWSEWCSKDYNKEYYSEITPDGRYLMEWLVDWMKKMPPVSTALEFGCGPTVLHTFPLIPKAREIHLAEYLAVNRTEVENWIGGGANAHNWRPFTLEFLRLEGNPSPTEADAIAREQLVRSRITHVFPADAGNTDPLGPDKRGYYELVTTLCCADSATSSKETWREYMRNIASLVKPGGIMIVCACGLHSFYRIGNLCFPGASISPVGMLACLGDIGFSDIDLRLRQVPDSSGQGFCSTILARGVMGGGVCE